jgi:hypothetical protein
MIATAYVILLDGRLDPNSAHLIPGDVQLDEIVFPVISNNIVTQARYDSMRLAGESHNMAEVLATRCYPGVKSYAIFNDGKFSTAAGKIGVEQQWLAKQAESVGVSTTGKWYCRGLASFPGDPTAWVESRGDVLRIAKEKNMTVHGYVEHQGYETDPGNDEVISEDIINNEVMDIVDSNPGVDQEQVREEVYKLRTGAVDNNPLLVQD